MDWPVIIGISSAVIALCALIFTIRQFAQARKHSRLSFRPHLTTWTDQDAAKGSWGLELLNNGLGPAIIETFVVKVDGKNISGDGAEPIEKALKILFPNFAYHARQSYLAKGYSMSAKERCTIVAVQFLGPQLPTAEFVGHAINRSALEISYKSFYDEIFYFSTEEESSNKPLQWTR